MEFKKPLSPQIDQRSSKEKEPTSFDAIHFINYEIVGEGKKSYPETRGLMSINAIADLLEQGVAKNAVIGGVIRYKTEDSFVSKFYADILRQKLAKKLITRDAIRIKILKDFNINEEKLKEYLDPKPPEGINDYSKDVNEVQNAIIKEAGINIIAEAEMLSKEDIKKGAMETGGEVDFMLNRIKENHWNRVLVVGYRDHLDRIKKLYKNKQGTDVDDSEKDITFKSSADVLEESHLDSTKKFEKTPFRKWEGLDFEKSEKTKILFMDLFDPKGKLISFAAKAIPERLKLMMQSKTSTSRKIP